MNYLCFAAIAVFASTACAKEEPPAAKVVADTSDVATDSGSAGAEVDAAASTTDVAQGTDAAADAAPAETDAAGDVVAPQAIGCVEQPLDLPLSPSQTVKLPCDLVPPGLQ